MLPLACLVIALFGFVQAETPLLGVTKEEAGHVRATVLLAAAWFALFAVPLFLFTPDRPSTGIALGRAARDEGDGVLIMSSELDEIMALSDRILVMFKGRIVAEFDATGAPVDRNAIGLAMAGAAA